MEAKRLEEEAAEAARLAAELEAAEKEAAEAAKLNGVKNPALDGLISDSR